MDTQYQIKATPSEHNQGVHVCQECGWPFPQLHPSGKHRRAHKRICGTIEGYTGFKELTHLAISDDEPEHPSDEDCKTPSPKFEKRSIIGRGGVGGTSNRSEDEVFSDAAAEFSDSGFSPGIEESLEGVKELNKNVERTGEGDMGGIISLKVDAIAESSEPLNSPPENCKLGNPKVLDSENATIVTFQDTRTKEIEFAARSTNNSPCDFSLVKSETLADAPRDITNATIGHNRKHNLTAYIRQETDVKANKDEVDESLMDVEEPRSTTVGNTSEPEIDGKSSHSVSADGFVESMQCESFETEMSVHGHSPLSESVEHMEASVNTIQVKADPIEDTDSGTHSDLYPSSCRSEKENIQSNCNLQGMQPHSRASHMVSSVDDKVNHTTRLSEGDRNNQHEMVQVEVLVAVGNESSEGVIKEDITANSNTNFTSDDSHQTTKLTEGDDIVEHGKAAIELSDKAWSEEYRATSMIINLEPERKFSDSNYLASIPDTAISDIDTSVSSNMMPTHPNSKNFLGNDSQEVRIEPEVNSESEVVAECVGGGIVGSKLIHNGDVEVPEENSENPIIKEQGLSPINSEISHGSSTGVISKPTQESDDKLTKQPGGASAVDISADSSSQTDCVEGNLGSISVLSVQSIAYASTGTGTLPKTEPIGLGNSENATLHPKITSERQHSDKADVFESPSFMTLVEPKRGGTGSEFEIVQSTQQPNSEALQTAWFPSLTNVVNKSPGRKKNEEIIAKVTNWSTGKQDGTSLKNLLGEAKDETRSKSTSPKQTENDETAGEINGTSATTMKEVLGSEAPADQAVKKETVEEWNSPARYPVEIKKEKRKVKGKPSWVPFVCCSSVH